MDVATVGPGEEVAVARTSGGEAYAFSSESYLHNWRRPGWKLDPGGWTVTVRASSSDAEVARQFRFEVLSDGALTWRVS